MHRKAFSLGQAPQKDANTPTAQNNAGHALRQQQSNKDLKGRNNLSFSDDIITVHRKLKKQQANYQNETVKQVASHETYKSQQYYSLQAKSRGCYRK